jgi:hypothetical protein
MSKAVKAALLSGFVLPGVGQYYLGHKLRGGLFILAVFVAIFALVKEASKQAQTVIEQIQQQGGYVSNERIIELASQSTQQADGLLINIAMFILLGSWIISIVDAYRLGKSQSIQLSPENKP